MGFFGVDQIRAMRGGFILAMMLIYKEILYSLRFKRRYHNLVARLVKKTGLFDSTYYLSYNRDVAGAGWDPLYHYVAHGDRERRWPMPLFDPDFYATGADDPGCARVNTLLHYYYVGRHRRVSPSPWFDIDYYLSRNKDVRRAGIDPLLHFLRIGGQNGRSPSEAFDAAWYLTRYPDVVRNGINPLLHYLTVGRVEGRLPRPEAQQEQGGEPIPNPTLPSDADWGVPQQWGKQDVARVDVVVPVYKGFEVTLRCLHSVVHSRQTTPYELIVINDGSPDAKLVAALERLAVRGFFTLLHNESNRGFVHTVNRGMMLHPDRDVVLLNSDTEVYGDWLDRLVRAATRNPSTGTVTPLSNNATICSYPHFNRDNPYPLEVAYEAVDQMTSRVNADLEVEAPTAVGFCMYIRRDCLDAVGYFDEETFGRGYGEENDFCQRAIRLGWRNVIAGDVFVRHWGAASFQGEKASRIREALENIARLYPNYHRDVARFIDTDPLREVRRRIDLARLDALVKQENVLIVNHNRGGGSERHVQEDIRVLGSQGRGVFTLRPAARKTHVAIAHPATGYLPNLGEYDLADQRELVGQLRRLRITEVHVHSLVDLDDRAPGWISALARELGAKLEINVHDYTVICPRINLVNETGLFCGEPDEDSCSRCLERNGSDFSTKDIRLWRAAYHDLLKNAARVDVPNEDVAERLQRYFPDVHCVVTPHEDLGKVGRERKQLVLAMGDKLHIVVVGAISRIKGYDVLLQCALDARKRKLPLKFSVLGYGMDDRKLKAAGVEVTGRYLEDQAFAKLEKLQPHVIWLPSVWPETYSYTLSIALQSHLPVFAFDLGAIPRRLRETDCADGLMPIDLAARPGKINEIFVAHRNRIIQPIPAAV